MMSTEHPQKEGSDNVGREGIHGHDAVERAEQKIKGPPGLTAEREARFQIRDQDAMAWCFCVLHPENQRFN